MIGDSLAISDSASLTRRCSLAPPIWIPHQPSLRQCKDLQIVSWSSSSISHYSTHSGRRHLFNPNRSQWRRCIDLCHGIGICTFGLLPVSSIQCGPMSTCSNTTFISDLKNGLSLVLAAL